MAQLSDETLMSIFSNLDTDDLCNVRLTCKSFNTMAERLLFKNLTVWINTESLQRLVKVASSHLGEHVQKLTVGMEAIDREFRCFRDYKSFLTAQWEDTEFKLPPNHNVDPSIDLDRAKAGWEAFNSRYEYELPLRRFRGPSFYLRAAMDKLPYLHTLVIAGDETLQTSPPKISWGVQPIMDRILVSPLYMAHTVPDKNLSGRQLLEAIYAVALSGVRIQTLEIWDVEVYSGQAIARLTEPHLRLAVRAFEYVTRLFIDSPWKVAGRPGREVSKIPAFMGTLRGLEELAWMGSRSDQTIPGLLFPAIMARLERLHHFSLLRVLELKSLQCSENALVELLTHYSHTVRHLSIDGMQLDGGTFHSLFPRMRSTIRLRKLCFGGTFEQWTEGVAPEEEWLPLTVSLPRDMPLVKSICRYVMRDSRESDYPTDEMVEYYFVHKDRRLI